MDNFVGRTTLDSCITYQLRPRQEKVSNDRTVSNEFSYYFYYYLVSVNINNLYMEIDLSYCLG
jgi:hypothetical protein